MALIVCDLAQKIVQILGFWPLFVLGELRNQYSKGSIEDMWEAFRNVGF